MILRLHEALIHRSARLVFSSNLLISWLVFLFMLLKFSLLATSITPFECSEYSAHIHFRATTYSINYLESENQANLVSIFPLLIGYSGSGRPVAGSGLSLQVAATSVAAIVNQTSVAPSNFPATASTRENW